MGDFCNHLPLYNWAASPPPVSDQSGVLVRGLLLLPFTRHTRPIDIYISAGGCY